MEKEEEFERLAKAEGYGNSLLKTHAKWGWDQAIATMRATEQGHVVVTRNQAGQIVAVTRQDEEGRILKVIAE